MNTRCRCNYGHGGGEPELDRGRVASCAFAACREPFRCRRARCAFDGHAIAARICAEEAGARLLPNAVKLQVSQWPQIIAVVRVDAVLLSSGDTVSGTATIHCSGRYPPGRPHPRAGGRAGSPIRADAAPGSRRTSKRALLRRILPLARAFLKCAQHRLASSRARRFLPALAPPAPERSYLAALACTVI